MTTNHTTPRSTPRRQSILGVIAVALIAATSMIGTQAVGAQGKPAERDTFQSDTTTPASTPTMPSGAGSGAALDGSKLTEVTWLAEGTGEVPDDLAVLAPTADTAPGSIDDLAGEAPTPRGNGPTATGDLISNQGCRMVDPEPGQHLGANCIDKGWLNRNGSIYVSTEVPAHKAVYVSSNPEMLDPEIVGYDLGWPVHVSTEFDKHHLGGA